MANSGFPREIYIGGLLIMYVFVTLMYAGYGTSMQLVYPDCEAKPTSEGCTPNPLGSGYINNNPLMPEETKSIFGYIIVGFPNVPDWLNIGFKIFSVIIILLIAILIIHG